MFCNQEAELGGASVDNEGLLIKYLVVIPKGGVLFVTIDTKNYCHCVHAISYLPSVERL